MTIDFIIGVCVGMVVAGVIVMLYFVDKEKPDEYTRGCNCALEAINRGEFTAQELLEQARSDPYPDDFTKGWKDICKIYSNGKS